MTAARPPADFLSRLAARALGLGPAGTPRIASIFEPPPVPSEALDRPEDAETRLSPPAEPDMRPAPAIPIAAPAITAAAPAAAAPESAAPPAVAAEPLRNGAPRLIQPAELIPGVARVAARSRDEPEPLAGERLQTPPAAAPARPPAPGPRPMAIVAVTPRPVDREPGPVEAQPAPEPVAAPAAAAAPGRARPAAPAPEERPMTFATPLILPFAPSDRPAPVASTAAIALPPRRERRPAFDRGEAAPEGPSVNITIGRVEVRAAVPAAAERRLAPAPRGEPPQSLADYLKRRDRAR